VPTASFKSELYFLVTVVFDNMSRSMSSGKRVNASTWDQAIAGAQQLLDKVEQKATDPHIQGEQGCWRALHKAIG